jgi:sialate O-acetylesterase
MGTPFVDNAILQRQMPVPVWGRATTGETITVSFAGQSKTATADGWGKWTLNLDALEANANAQKMLITSSAGGTITLGNILVGEVWMASGQSNMQWPANKCIVGRKLIKEILARVEAGEEMMPIIREGKAMDVFSSLTPTERARGEWSAEWQGFSAISFAFAYDVWKEVKVPVGIANCAFSTTSILAWTPREGFAAGTDEHTRAIYRKVYEGDYRTSEHKAAWDQYYQGLRDWATTSGERAAKGLPLSRVPGAPGNLRGNRDACWMYNGKMAPMAPYAVRGAIWNQGYASQGDGVFYRNNLHSLIRGWRKVWNRPDLPVYFHQFYCPGKGGDDGITLNSAAEMRLGTSLASKEIPNAAMASQIDITGGVHYYNKAVPGQRLARHALKNQYGKDIIADGPMYRSYSVEGDKLILSLDYADGLVAGQSMTVRGGFADPVVLENGEEQVKLFYIADKDRVWHQAKVKIAGDKIVLSAPGLSAPVGVAYGCNGVGTQPGIYNKAMLPLTPFIYYDNELVTSGTWPMEYIKIAGKVVDPTTYGLRYKHRKLPLLSPQFRPNGVIQAGVPTRFFGAALPGSVVKVSFAGSEQTVTVGPNKSDWEATFPASPASIEPKTLHVACEVDGELAHERRITGLVVGDVWYVALQDNKFPRVKGWPKPAAPTGMVRMFMAFAMKRTHAKPDRFKLSSSGTQSSRFFSVWATAEGLAKELGDKINAKTGQPVGIIIMNTSRDLPIKAWVGYEWLKNVPAWKADADQLYSRYAPDPKAYAANAETFIADWKTYWEKIATDPAFRTSNASGGTPRFPGAKGVKTPATMTYNMLIAAFGPGNFKGIVCLTPKSFYAKDQGASFGEEFSVMANCWKETFARGQEILDPYFFYTMPGKASAPKVTKPSGIKGKSTGLEVKSNAELIEQIVNTVY